ncbi:hypothetical protein L5G28_06775 [Gordonia sp. HY285]|uniref:hypothetical protein n=1 Tax=Gordonia liuliyuniae TaxID=2911517 RepID=UPI001F4345EF|nr:hypothetical protein [Gordonia liuliyuniae]MCF8609865.1 hypothetical protein [Gordonia liuliyuniae]
MTEDNTDRHNTDREDSGGDHADRNDADRNDADRGAVATLNEPQIDEQAPADKTADDGTGDEKAAETLSQKNARGSGGRRQVMMSIPALIASLVAGLLIIVLAATAVLFVLRDSSARSDLDSMRATAADEADAEMAAGKYAVSAATLDYQDLTPWITAMKKGVSPELSKRYDAVGQTMEQIITPLRMKTSAELVTTSLSDSEGDLFRVDAVVNVNTTTVQNPSGGNAVAVYKLTLDRSKDWLITEVGDPTNTVAGNLGSTSDAPAAPAAPAPGN